MPAAKPIAARRLPACAPEPMAEFFAVEVAALDEVPEGVDEELVGDDEFDAEAGEPSAEEALAAAWNAAKLLFAVGLMAKTMPCSQWPVWWQKNQSGVVAFTVSEKEGTVVALAETGRKPESMPLARGWHGAAKDDCVTVWFLG